MIDTRGIRQRWEAVGSKLDERERRVFAAGEVRAAGWGGLAAVSAITGLARSTIGRGLKDLDAAPLPKGRERRKGGGRRHLSSRDATLIEDLRGIIEPATLGDPMRPLLWVSKSHDKVADALRKQGHEISASSVKRLLPTLGYSRQSNARPTRARSIPTAMRNSSTSTLRRSPHRLGSFYRSKHELVFVFKVGTAPHINTIELGRSGRYRTNVWDYGWPSASAEPVSAQTQPVSGRSGSRTSDIEKSPSRDSMRDSRPLTQNSQNSSPETRLLAANPRNVACS
jgi:hypothetical protein